jgi:hypothetical protein
MAVAGKNINERPRIRELKQDSRGRVSGAGKPSLRENQVAYSAELTLFGCLTHFSRYLKVLTNRNADHPCWCLEGI